MYYIGVDIGGTFTDCTVIGEDGTKLMAKSSSTPDDFSRGVIDVLKVAAGELRISVEELLKETAFFIHGCTVATNAIIERKGVPTGLVMSRGHEDTVIIGRVYQKRAGLSERELVHESKVHKAEPPIVDRTRIVGVTERLDYRGQVLIPLVEEEAEKAIDYLVHEKKVTSVAICLLWSFLDNRFERRIKEIIGRKYPGISVTTSYEVAPLMGEYERAVTALLTAYIKPVLEEYIGRLEQRLKDHGFGGELLLIHAGGGITSPQQIKEKPLLSLDSGPVGGILGGQYLCNLYKMDNIICTDMGGTSFDVGLIRGKNFHLETSSTVQQYTFLMPKVEVASIGSGGGSIIWVDPDGFLKVGPESAGAKPGPACYDRGGQRPTVTDANLVLGYLNPDFFLGGRIPLKKENAENALMKIAKDLGKDIVEVAAGAFKVVNAQMADLVRRSTIEKGYDPREFVLISYGGAGAAHCVYFARDIGVKKVYIPSDSTVFSAMGMITADILHSTGIAYPVKFPLSGNDLARINDIYGNLQMELEKQFKNEGIDIDKVIFTRFGYMKYGLQVHEIEVVFPNERLNESNQGLLIKAFEKKYEEIYGKGTGYARAGVEIIRYRVDGRYKRGIQTVKAVKRKGEAEPSQALKGRKNAYFVELEKFSRVRVFDGSKLRYGNVLEGPCIIERMGDTIVIPPKTKGYVDGFLNIIIDLG